MSNDQTKKLVTKSQLVGGLRETGLGHTEGEIVLLHTKMSALGHVIGGAQTIIESVLKALGPQGTLMTLTSWQDMPPYHQQDWPPVERAAFLAECPAFDPKKARADRQFGRVPEAVRTWPTAHHSYHPVCSFAAIGPQAESVLSHQTLDEGYGKGSPLERLVELGGHVLLLGAPLETVTLLHYSEYLASVPEKRWNEFEMPVLIDGERVWHRFRELDSSLGAFRYEGLGLNVDAFEAIVSEALSAGVGSTSAIGDAGVYLFDAKEFAAFGVDWMEARFGQDAWRRTSADG